MNLRVTTIFLITISTIISTIAVIPSEMEALMDKTINPCTDFYHYACGTWVKENPSTSRYIELRRSYDMIEQKNQELIVEIAKEKHPILSEWWDSCMDIKTITKLGNTPLKSDLERIQNAQTRQELMFVAGQLSSTGTNTFSQWSLMKKKDKKYGINWTAPYNELPDDSLLQDYKNYIKNLLILSDFQSNDETPDTIIKMTNELIEYERGIESNSILRLTFPKYTYERAKKRWPLTFGAYSKGMEGIKKTSLHVEDFYFDKLEKWIQTTSLQDLKSYVAFHMIHSRVLWLGSDYYNLWYEYYGRKIKNMENKPERQSFCHDMLLKYLPDLIGMYFKKTILKEKENIMEIMTLIQQSMKNHFLNSRWLETKEKKKAISKLQQVEALIGLTPSHPSYPSVFLRDNYPLNMQTLFFSLFQYEMNKIGRQEKQEDTTIFTIVPKLSYDDHYNMLNVYPSILQPPFYNGSHVHPARNFGAIGFLIGHELMHGFDYDASQVGNYKDLWNRNTREIYNTRATCFEFQYEKLYKQYETRFHLHGQLSHALRIKKRKNIADNTALALAWDAYRQYITRTQPNIEISKREEGDKLFFITLGQALCSSLSEDKLREQVVRSVYSPTPVRVNAIIMNNEHFGKVFRCQTDSPMNPHGKCKIW